MHDRAGGHDDTDWREVASLYGVLEEMTGNPMVSLNRAVAVAMVDGPSTGLALLDGVSERLDDHHRLHAVSAHLLRLAGDTKTAMADFKPRPPAPRTSASGTTSPPRPPA